MQTCADKHKITPLELPEGHAVFPPDKSSGGITVCGYLRAACRGEASCEDGSAVNKKISFS